MDSKEYLKSNTIKNRHFIVHQNNGISFNDNTTRSTLQKKRIEVIRSSANCTIIQMFRGCKIGNDIMLDHDFNDHCMKANTYYKNAKDHLNSRDLQDGINKTVAHHDGQNKVCGKFPWNGHHAEIQILNDFQNTTNLEMGISFEMCGAKYSRPRTGQSISDTCNYKIQNGYENNKVIFAKDPNALYVFPRGKCAAVTSNEILSKEYCATCGCEIPTGKFLCDSCMDSSSD